MRTIYFVYVLTFKSGKVYIGMSKTDSDGLYDSRYKSHEYAARSGKQLPVYSAWRKHGAPSRHIISTHDTRQECCEAEINAITMYDSTNNKKGYNILKGGQGQDSATNPVMHALMREKVWDNPVWRAKVSAALKGRQLSPETKKGYAEFCKTPAKSELGKIAWRRPEYREMKSAATKKQMAEGGSDHLKRIFAGRKDPRSAEGKELQRQKVIAYSATPEGRASTKKGYKAFASNPANLAAARAGQDIWRASDANKIQCRNMAKLSAEKCSKKVIDKNTGEIYDSQRAMAKALDVSEASISRYVKDGKVSRC